MSESKLREQICELAKSMFDRGLTGGSTGNISARTEDGGLLVSPTGTSFGRLDPGRLSRFNSKVGWYLEINQPKRCRCIALFMTHAAKQALWFICIHVIRLRCHSCQMQMKTIFFRR